MSPNTYKGIAFKELLAYPHKGEDLLSTKKQRRRFKKISDKAVELFEEIGYLCPNNTQKEKCLGSLMKTMYYAYHSLPGK